MATAQDHALMRTAYAVPEEIANEIWSKTLGSSLVMRLAQRIELPGDGKEFPIITGDAEPDWVAEGASKPVSTFTFDKKTIKPYKLAVIAPFSDEFRRDRNALYNAVVERIPALLAAKFDRAVFSHDENAVPGEKFDNFAGIDDIDLQAADTTVYEQLVKADTDINVAGYLANGYAITPQMRGLLLGEVDGVGRPLFNPSVSDDIPDVVFGSPAILAQPNGINTNNLYSEYNDEEAQKVIKTLGIVGDWRQAFYGTVEGVSLTLSDTATLDTGDGTLNLWQDNMFAVRAEIEVGFGIKDEDAFKRLVLEADPS